MQNKTRKKRKNLIENYFSPFGIKQVCDILMLLSAVMIIVGLAVYKNTDIVLIIAMSMFILGSLLALYRSIKIMTSGLNKRSPEYKAALVNAIIMVLLFILALVGLIYCIARR